ncbi:MAG: hypothetical protein WCY82_00115 [Desulfotomaculaceae bacterium]
MVNQLINKFCALLFGRFFNQSSENLKRAEANSVLLARLHIQRLEQTSIVRSLKEIEFKVFSQWGEDGIIQYVLSKIHVENEVFIEFGVGNYRESNTRFLLVNNNWKGIVIEGNPRYVDQIQSDRLYWRYDLTAVCRFITRDNINQIITGAGISGDIGLLSIDIDGNDYWVWEAIDVVNPRIVVCEYNSIFGADHAVTIPYDPQFYIGDAHYSHLYYGCSLPALCRVAGSKGYSFIGCNSAGCNAFFVRKDLSQPFKLLSAKEGYVSSRFRISRDISGRLNYVSGPDRTGVIAHLNIYDLELGTTRPLKDLLEI